MDKNNEPRHRSHPSNSSHDLDARRNGHGSNGEAEAQIADRLAAYTDAVLTGRKVEAHEAAEVPPQMAFTIEMLAARAARTAQVRDDPVQQRRLKAQVMAAWDEAQTPWWERLGATLQTRIRTAMRTAVRTVARQPAWGAAMALLVVAFGVLLLAPMGVDPLPGTAEGPLGAGVWAGLGVLTLAAAVVIWWMGRRRK